MASSNSEIKTGWEQYRKGDWSGAEQRCLQVLSQKPAHAGALGLLGMLRLGAGRVDEASTLLDQALRGNPGDAALASGLGVACLMQGNAPAAEQSFRNALKWGRPNDALVHMRLGMALGAQGRMAEAIAELRRAQAITPDQPDVMLNLASALAESGQTAEAEQQLRRLLTKQPAHGDARFNLGTLLIHLGRLDEAEREFRALLQYFPDSADAYNSLGIVLDRQSLREQAGDAYRKALALDPQHVSALNNLGNVLRAQGNVAEASTCYSEAMRLMPAHPDGYLNQGILFAEQLQWAEAIKSFLQALSLDGKCIEAALNLAEAHRRTGALKESVEAFHRALSIHPDSAPALNGLGDCLRMLGRSDEAAQYYSRAIRTRPLDPAAFLNLGVLRAQQGNYDEACALLRQAVKVDERHEPAQLKLAEALRVNGQLEESTAVYRQLLSLHPRHAAASAGLAHVLQHQCDWAGIETLWDISREAIREGNDIGITPFSVLSIPSTPQEQQACARAWAKREVGWIADTYPEKRTGSRQKKQKLKLGYLSWDYHEHATAYLMAEVFELHDRGHFGVTAYSYGPDTGSEIGKRIRGGCDDFVDIAHLSDEEAARRIVADGIDILVDLKGYTLGARTGIVAYRPAPVQVNWLGFPGTMGAPFIDWILADSFILPRGAEQYFDEKVYRLPDCYQPNDRRREIAVTPTRADCGLPESVAVFCCFNQAYKILPDMFSAWMRILHHVPDSVLWLLESNHMAMSNLRLNAEKQGVDSKRIIFAPRTPLAEHLARYRVADLALDTFPYTSHTTASDAIWGGCPLIARVGETFASRVSGSVLNAAGLSELVAANGEEFESMAIKIANDPERLATLRQYLGYKRMEFPLFDSPRFVSNLETAYKSMW